MTPDEIAVLADALSVRLQRPSPWMDTRGVAAYLQCGVKRIHALTASRGIPFHREGGRLLFHRDEIDEWILTGSRRS